MINKGGIVLESTLQLLPMLKTIPQTWLSKVDALNTLKGIIPSNWLSTLYARTPLHPITERERTEHLSIDPTAILLTHHALLFNADRVTLLATNDLQATIQGFFLPHTALYEHKNTLREKGLLHFCNLPLPQELESIRKIYWYAQPH